MIILTILNTLAIVYLLIAKQTHLPISLRRVETTWGKNSSWLSYNFMEKI